MTQKIQLIDENLLYYSEGNGKVVRVIDDEFHVVAGDCLFHMTSC